MWDPFVIYADFECFTEKISTCNPDKNNSFTNQYQHHKPCGFSTSSSVLTTNFFNLNKSHTHTHTHQYSQHLNHQTKTSKIFVDSLEESIKNIYRRLKFKKKGKYVLWWLESIWEGYTLDGDKVSDHCHLTGRYRGASHESCNINFSLSSFIIYQVMTNIYSSSSLARRYVKLIVF